MMLADIRQCVADRVATAGIDAATTVHAYPPKDYALPTVLVLPASDQYVNYHGTFGSSRQSGQERLDEFLSSGTAEDLGLADAISGADVTIGTGTADIYVSSAENYITGQLERSTTTPVHSCDLPVIVRVKRI